MDLRSLECFVAVAEEGSVSRAAVRLHVSQPPLSVRLKALERELGVPLLVRHGRGVDLTPSGRVLLERGRRLLADLDSASAAVRAVGEGTQGRLSLVIGRTVTHVLLGDLLAGVRASAPEVTIDVVELPDAEVLDRVRAGTTDAGLVHLPPPVRSPRAPSEHDRGYDQAVVRREPLLALLPADDAPAGAERVDLAQLRGRRIVTPARATSPALHSHALLAMDTAQAAPYVHEVESLNAVLALVRAGFGIALLPASAAPRPGAGMTTRPLQQHTLPVETAVLWRTAEEAPVLRRFLRVAMSTPEPDVLEPEHARPDGP